MVHSNVRSQWDINSDISLGYSWDMNRRSFWKIIMGCANSRRIFSDAQAGISLGPRGRLGDSWGIPWGHRRIGGVSYISWS